MLRTTFLISTSLNINTVNRYRPQGDSQSSYPLRTFKARASSQILGAYDYRTIHAIINSTAVLHVSFNPLPPAPGPFPVTLPMIGCTGSFDDQGSDPATEIHDLYLHGYVSSRLMKLSTNAECPEPGAPVCIAATLFDGLVLALTPYHNSCNYRSAIVYACANLVTDDAERLFAMERITNNMASSL